MALIPRFILVFAMLFALALLVRAQEPQPKLAGSVTQADTGSPIEGATITLMPPFVAGQLHLQTARTDREGNFLFERIADGTYSITASANGFAQEDYKRDASPESGFLRVDSSTSSQDIDFQLKPEAIIRGTIIDGAGKPVADLSVTAVEKEAKNSGRVVASAQTDANGQFVLRELPPGTYLVCANGPAGYGASSSPSSPYREIWYGGTVSSEGAIPIPLKERDERNGVRIAVERETRYRVVIWLSGPEGEPTPDRYDVLIQNRSHVSMKQSDGSYVIPDIPPGHYTLVSTAWSGVKYLGQGEESFDVSGADATLHVHLGGLGEIAGTVKWAGAPVLSTERALFEITSEEGATQTVRVNAQGHFDVSDVLPGRYRFKPFQVDPVAIPQSIQCGRKEINDDSPLQVGDREMVLDCKVTLAIP
jgi:5-hydroxyisourate hydrolase-like protein (transthyretin family)